MSPDQYFEFTFCRRTNLFSDDIHRITKEIQIFWNLLFYSPEHLNASVTRYVPEIIYPVFLFKTRFLGKYRLNWICIFLFGGLTLNKERKHAFTIMYFKIRRHLKSLQSNTKNREFFNIYPAYFPCEESFCFIIIH